MLPEEFIQKKPVATTLPSTVSIKKKLSTSTTTTSTVSKEHTTTSKNKFWRTLNQSGTAEPLEKRKRKQTKKPDM